MQIEISRWDALLFDLDGTLVDTMPLHYRAYADVLAARGLSLSHADFLTEVGAPAREAIPRFVRAGGGRDCSAEEAAAIHADKKAAFAGVLATARLAPLRAAELLDAAGPDMPVALVSSGNRAGVTAILQAMGWADRFRLVVTGDDVTHGKPHPEPYLRAAPALGVPPAR